jgi:hypothetical protein
VEDRSSISTSYGTTSWSRAPSGSTFTLPAYSSPTLTAWLGTGHVLRPPQLRHNRALGMKNRCSLHDPQVFTQLPVLPTQLRQLRLLAGGRPRPVATVDLGLHHPAPHNSLSQVQVPCHLGDRSITPPAEFHYIRREDWCERALLRRRCCIACSIGEHPPGALPLIFGCPPNGASPFHFEVSLNHF